MYVHSPGVRLVCSPSGTMVFPAPREILLNVWVIFDDKSDHVTVILQLAR